MVTPVVFLYPKTKRFFKVHQFVLGLTFNSGVFIGYAAVSAALAADMSICLPFYAGGVLWTIVYDTIYAFQDREFDKRLGLKSAAITFEQHPKAILSAISAASVACFALGGFNAGLGSAFYVGLSAVAGHYAWQIKTLNIDDPKRCWDLFTSNKYLGLMLMVAIVLGRLQA